MYLNGGIESVTLHIRKVNSSDKEHVKRKKWVPTPKVVEYFQMAYWAKIVEKKDYRSALQFYVENAMKRYVESKYKGKYELIDYEDLYIREDNYDMADVPMKRAMRLMTTKEFFAQFGDCIGIGDVFLPPTKS